MYGIHKLFKLINKFSKIAGYKINTKKPTVFVYTTNKQSEIESKRTISYETASKRIKYLGINLIKEVKTYIPCTDLEDLILLNGNTAQINL